MTAPEDLQSWNRLAALAAQERDDRKVDPASMRLTTDGLLMDFSRQRVDQDIIDALLALARETGVEAAIENLFEGALVNVSERRAALHTAMRAPHEERPEAVADLIEAEQARMLDVARRVREGDWRGATGKPFSTVVHIGIGGSRLGPELVVNALGGDFDIRFLSNVDGNAAILAFADLDPNETLIVVASKSFGTLETLTNARFARSWLLERTGDANAVAQHFVAVTANVEAARDFGIPADRCLPIWDWIGGRYSLWSAVGLPIAIALGETGFCELLDGAHDMDRHFRTAPPAQNLPLMLALLGIWNNNFLDGSTHAMLVYDSRLAILPQFLQQLEMESSGKSVTNDGSPSRIDTAPVIWGGEETDGQHAFHQLLHQGTRAFSADFIAVADPGHDLADQHRWLLANCLGQGEALLAGAPSPADAPHQAVAGNHPSTTLLLDRLDDRRLGMLLALYEHKVFCQSVIWGINPFDQWGVELGKQLARRVYDALGEDSEADDMDAATASLVDTLKKPRP
ncbi:MAG: glucose-6-phosphate isomerase [Gammaproteobacteria bacterium]|nr:glucose-6-phosphate isomerase [Gammaproteobacteria bacterium]